MQTALFLFLLSTPILFVDSACPNDCSGHGWCQSDICICEAGRFEKDCSKSVKDDYSNALIGIQATLGTIFFIIAILCAIALYHAIARKLSSVAVVNNIQFVVFGSYFIVAVVQTIYAGVDPLRVWGIMNVMTTNILFSNIFPFSLFAFVSVLFHWIDLINISVTTLRKEEMLQKISIHYKPKDVTLEDMVEKLQFLGKLKIPFAVLIILEFLTIYITQIVGALMKGLLIILFNVMLLVVLLYYGVTSIGFLIYRKKLISIMPVELTKKVRRLTDRVTMLCVFILVAIVVLAVVFLFVPRDQPAGYLALWTVVQLVEAFVCLANVSVFLNWKRRFPFVIFSGTQSTQSTKGSKGQPASREIEELDETGTEL